MRFLAGCLAQPAKGRAVLAGIDEGFFATREMRDALSAVKERLELDGPGGKARAGDAGATAETGEVLAEVVVLAGRERFTDNVVDELFLRLQEAQVGRLIARLKLTVQDDATGRQSKELASLQAAGRRLREAIRAVPVDEEPHEG